MRCWDKSAYLIAPIPTILPIALPLLLGQFGILLGDDSGSATNRFIQQGTKRNRFTGTRTHEFPVLSQDTAKFDVLQVEVVSKPPCQAEQLLKVEMLRSANDIPDGIRMPLFDPILDRRNIGRRIPKSAVGFPNDKWILRQRAVPDNDRSFAYLSEPSVLQLLHNSRQFRVIEAFAQLIIKPHPKEIVDLRKFLR